MKESRALSLSYHITTIYNLEDTEDLLDVECLVDCREVFNDVESDGLGKRSALANSYDVTFSNIEERRGAVNRHVSVLLGETTVLREVLQVISSDNEGSLHLVGNNHGLQNSTTDGDIASKWALLVNVVTLNRGLGGLEAKADALVVSHAFLRLLAKNSLLANEDGILLLVCLFGLVSFSKLGHFARLFVVIVLKS
eukprot:CAMPEP_0202971630 /NCGR_PEP_ID=MMETSP1396-20130829/28813_1 /ASSEMBLY_ACC=CAM_ASM_000872 /TAXON_ID= /ORGANISM="Pseudokeronopsis sp., Strain Brazil" /LENGTH=195 /DNA_ID=CAMNT_0049701183 /DNA_START=44 /DNA_END=628 /DNA_ORIENTATION=+